MLNYVTEQIRRGMKEAFFFCRIKQEMSECGNHLCAVSQAVWIRCYSWDGYAVFKAGKNTSEPPNPNPPGMLWIL